LRNELRMDQDCFWERNLGRDDRICVDHGKKARFPFLDSNVTDCLRRLPLDLICDFCLPQSKGDKRILRLVAMRLGLDHASGLVKRAIQFGSRISHLSDAKRFGSRRKAKGERRSLVSSTKCRRFGGCSDLLCLFLCGFCLGFIFLPSQEIQIICSYQPFNSCLYFQRSYAHFPQ
jgi:asparagine synthetase B (glutamine-hydrolysing)